MKKLNLHYLNPLASMRSIRGGILWFAKNTRKNIGDTLSKPWSLSPDCTNLLHQMIKVTKKSKMSRVSIINFTFLQLIMYKVARRSGVCDRYRWQARRRQEFHSRRSNFRKFHVGYPEKAFVLRRRQFYHGITASSAAIRA